MIGEIDSTKLSYEGDITIDAQGPGPTTVAVTNSSTGTANLSVQGDVTVVGGKITLASGETIDAETADVVTITSDGNVAFLLGDVAGNKKVYVYDSTGTNDVFSVDSDGNISADGDATIAGSFVAAASTLASLTVSGTATISGLATGTTNTVVTHDNGLLQTRTIDSKVWNGALVDYAASTSGYLPMYSNNLGTLTNSSIFETGGNVGIGTTSPRTSLEINGNVTFSGTTNQRYIQFNRWTEPAEVPEQGLWISEQVTPLTRKSVIRSCGGVSESICLATGRSASTEGQGKLYLTANEYYFYNKSNISTGLSIANSGCDTPNLVTLDGSPNLSSVQTGDVFTDEAGSSFPITSVDDVNDIIGISGTCSTNGENDALATRTTEKMRINSAGNVGIGTTSPEALFHVRSSDAYPFIRLTGTGANSQPGIEIDRADARRSMGLFLVDNATAGNPHWFTGVPYNGGSNISGYSIGYGIDGWEVGGSKLYISTTGNVGIGTTAPGAQLQVAGDTLLDEQIALGGTSIDNQIYSNLNVSIAPSSYVIGYEGRINSSTNQPIYGGQFRGYGLANSGTTSQIRGVTGEAWNSGTGTITSAYGGKFTAGTTTPGTASPITNAYAIQNQTVNLGSSTIGTAVGVDTTLWNYGTGAITTGSVFKGIVTNTNASGTLSTVYGLNLSGWSNSGTVSNSYGIYLDNSIDIGSNRYALYSGSASNSYFAGNVGIGTTNPQSAVHILRTNEAIRLDGGSSGGTYMKFVRDSDSSSKLIGHAVSILSSGSVNSNGLVIRGDAGIQLVNSNSGTNGISIVSGNVGIGTTAPGAYKVGSCTDNLRKA